MKKTSKQLLFERMHTVGGMPLKEDTSNGYKLLHYDGDDFNNDFEQYGLDIYDAANRAEEIAKNGEVTILSDKTLHSILIDSVKKIVIGGLWVSNNSDTFSWDIAIDSGYQNMGLSSMLIDEAISEYEYQKDVYGDDFNMEVDVINPKLAQILKSKYGFSVTGHLSQDRVLMTLD